MKPSTHIKTEPQDWCVYEQLPEVFSGNGEHLYCYVEKTSLNTSDVVASLAQAYQVKRQDVGYAGLKDKHAVTRQWFSVPTPMSQWLVEHTNLSCLRIERHHKKLRRGEHAANQFLLRLRHVQSVNTFDFNSLAADFPNYFGPQRTSSENFQQAQRWLEAGEWGARSRNNEPSARSQEKTGKASRSARRRGAPKHSGRRGWHMSVLRSVLFNQVLAQRVSEQNFAAAIDGDVLQDDKPTGPLWGRGRSATAGLARMIEAAALEPYAAICDGLEYAGVSQSRRPLAQRATDFAFETHGDTDVSISFSLPPGAYATTLLANSFNVIDASRFNE